MSTRQQLIDRYASLIEKHKHNRAGACWHLITRRLWVLRHGVAYETFTPYGCYDCFGEKRQAESGKTLDSRNVSFEQWEALGCEDTFDWSCGEHSGWIGNHDDIDGQPKRWRVVMSGNDGAYREVIISKSVCCSKRIAVLKAVDTFPEIVSPVYVDGLPRDFGHFARIDDNGHYVGNNLDVEG